MKLSNSTNKISLSALLSIPCVFAFLVLLMAAGCATSAPSIPTIEHQTPPADITLREGDNIKISFPGAPTLNTMQAIRRDGQIALPTLGDIKAAGISPAQLEKDILSKFGNQIITKEVSVTLDSAVFSIYINGAVAHPGEITSVRSLTALEAIMKAGGFDYVKANLKKVRVIRNEDGIPKTYTLNFSGLLDGKIIPPFYLKPSDVIYVPERFTLF